MTGLFGLNRIEDIILKCEVYLKKIIFYIFFFLPEKLIAFGFKTEIRA